MVLTALLLGPLFGPIFFSVMLQLSLDRSRVGADETIQLQVINGDAAPNLMAFLKSQRMDIVAAQGNAEKARDLIATRASRLVLEVPADYAARLAAAKPAALRLYSDSSRRWWSIAWMSPRPPRGRCCCWA